MKHAFILKKLPLLVLVSGLVLTVTFAQSNSAANNSGDNDTVPKKAKKVRDLDEALFELDKGEMELSKALEEIDGEKIEREIRAAMKSLDLDMSKMKGDLARAMKEIDMQKINVEIQKGLAELQNELKGIDGDKLKREIEQSMEKIDFDKMKIELDRMKEIDLSKMKTELENIRPEIEKSMQMAKKEMENAKIEIENIRPQIEKSMEMAKKDLANAKIEIEKARQEISDYKNLVNALDKDGLLNKNDNYKVEYKNKELTVNGKKLPADVARKYSEFLADKEDFTIKKEDDRFNLEK